MSLSQSLDRHLLAKLFSRSLQPKLPNLLVPQPTLLQTPQLPRLLLVSRQSPSVVVHMISGPQVDSADATLDLARGVRNVGFCFTG